MRALLLNTKAELGLPIQGAHIEVSVDAFLKEVGGIFPLVEKAPRERAMKRPGFKMAMLRLLFGLMVAGGAILFVAIVLISLPIGFLEALPGSWKIFVELILVAIALCEAVASAAILIAMRPQNLHTKPALRK